MNGQQGGRGFQEGPAEAQRVQLLADHTLIPKDGDEVSILRQCLAQELPDLGQRGCLLCRCGKKCVRRPGFQSWFHHIPVMHPSITLRVPESQCSFCKIIVPAGRVTIPWVPLLCTVLPEEYWPSDPMDRAKWTSERRQPEYGLAKVWWENSAYQRQEWLRPIRSYQGSECKMEAAAKDTRQKKSQEVTMSVRQGQRRRGKHRHNGGASACSGQ